MSDKEHYIQACLSNEQVQRWNLDRGDDISKNGAGTVLQVQEAEIVLEALPRKPDKARVYLKILDYKLLGCQGESIYGRPRSLQDEKRWADIIKIYRAWHGLQRPQLPIPESWQAIKKELLGNKAIQDTKLIDRALKDLDRDIQAVVEDVGVPDSGPTIDTQISGVVNGSPHGQILASTAVRSGDNVPIIYKDTSDSLDSKWGESYTRRDAKIPKAQLKHLRVKADGPWIPPPTGQQAPLANIPIEYFHELFKLREQRSISSQPIEDALEPEKTAEAPTQQTIYPPPEDWPSSPEQHLPRGKRAMPPFSDDEEPSTKRPRQRPGEDDDQEPTLGKENSPIQPSPTTRTPVAQASESIEISRVRSPGYSPAKLGASPQPPPMKAPEALMVQVGPSLHVPTQSAPVSDVASAPVSAAPTAFNISSGEESESSAEEPMPSTEIHVLNTLQRSKSERKAQQQASQRSMEDPALAGKKWKDAYMAEQAAKRRGKQQPRDVVPASLTPARMTRPAPAARATSREAHSEISRRDVGQPTSTPPDILEARSKIHRRDVGQPVSSPLIIKSTHPRMQSSPGGKATLAEPVDGPSRHSLPAKGPPRPVAKELNEVHDTGGDEHDGEKYIRRRLMESFAAAKARAGAVRRSTGDVESGAARAWKAPSLSRLQTEPPDRATAVVETPSATLASRPLTAEAQTEVVGKQAPRIQTATPAPTVTRLTSGNLAIHNSGPVPAADRAEERSNDFLQQFKKVYPEYSGDQQHMAKLCWLLRPLADFPPWLHDHFISCHNVHYAAYMGQQERLGREWLPYKEWYFRGPPQYESRALVTRAKVEEYAAMYEREYMRKRGTVQRGAARTERTVQEEVGAMTEQTAGEDVATERTAKTPGLVTLREAKKARKPRREPSALAVVLRQFQKSE